MTPAEKQERQKQRRQAKRNGGENMIDAEVYQAQVDKTLRRLHKAFSELAGENDPGRISIDLKGETLVISVKRVGDYTFSNDSSNQTFSLQSPESGIHNYKYDSANAFWKSTVQVHILEELLVREFIGHSKGLLDL